MKKFNVSKETMARTQIAFNLLQSQWATAFLFQTLLPSRRTHRRVRTGADRWNERHSSAGGAPLALDIDAL